jgi:hypothetical protein
MKLSWMDNKKDVEGEGRGLFSVKQHQMKEYCQGK